MLHGSSDLYGASRIFLISARSLKEEGHKVFVALSGEGPLSDALMGCDIPVKIIRLGVIRRKYFSPVGVINRFRTIRNAVKRLDEWIDREQMDTIYSNTAAIWTGAWLAKKNKLSHIWHLHEIISSPVWFAKFMGKLVNRYADKVIVVSQAVYDNWSPQVANSKLIRIYNGIDYENYTATPPSLREELKIPANTCVIGMIGRVNPWKGQTYFLEIANYLNKNFLDLLFILAGDAFPGEEYLYEVIRGKIKSYQLEEKVVNLGFREDVPRLLSTIDIFVLPSILPDPFPTVILEAMAGGKAVVATQHGGAVEMLDKGNAGILIPWDDPETAASQVSKLIEDHSRRKELGVKAKNRVLNHFSLTSFKKNLNRVLEEGPYH
jgi:glycosyltransferase involved in cell wall biosynthesis